MLIADPQARAQRAKDKRWNLLRLLRDEIFTNMDTAARVMQVEERAARSTVAAMEEEGLVKRHSVKVLTSLPPITLVGITSLGQANAFDISQAEQPLEKVFQTGKFSLLNLQHSLDLQNLRLDAVFSGKVKRWLPADRVMPSKKGISRPDAVLLNHHDFRLAIEVERTVKSPKRYTEILAGHLTAIQQNKWDRVVWASPDKETLDRVSAIILSIRYCQLSGVNTKLESKHHKSLVFCEYANFVNHI